MRVVAVTADPSLSVALQMMGDLEVVAASDVDEAVSLASNAGVVVVGLGTTDEGLALVESIFSQGITLPFVVVGDEGAPPGARAPVVERPFSLEDLQYAIDTAMRNGGTSAPTYEPEAPAEDPDAFHVPEPAVEGAPVEAAWQPAEPPVEAAWQPAEPAVEVPADLGAPVLEPAPVLGPEVEAPPEPPHRDPVMPAVSSPAPAPQRAAPPPQQRQSTRAPQRRKFGRKAQAPSDADSPIVRKLLAAARASNQLEEVLAELPMLTDVGSMTRALLNEILAMFSPDTAAVYLRGPSGFVVAAGHGLSKVETNLVVPETNPLFSELMRTPEAVLIAPVDLARGLVTGIGGTSTEALLAAPVSVDGRCVAVLIAGRHDFSDADLERIDDLAREAAPGLAVARLIDRLRRA